MYRTILALLLLISFSNLSFSQEAIDTTKSAKVIVNVTDRKAKPAKNEEILFRGQTKGTSFSGVTGKDGKFTIQVPNGDTYMVSVKSLNDTTSYGLIEVPALGPDQAFTAPFTIDIEFEPARSYTLDNVHFDFGRSSLRPESFSELEELVTFLKRKDEVKVEIAGHTDNIGKDDDNLKLSQDRANTIRNYLLKKGIQPTRVTAKGYGAKEPVADNTTDEGRQLNRRTEVRIL